ncbi:hypothetical protein HA050_12050 [Iodobacter sp. HSC-16F04]|uniref:Uncharacterized protein n=1 Tax=Iodobacter violaceini TaxID=3044271 RepID=A0ABX0L0G9_9NEIS|nr:hypothetical protein [Iodobacter violacea]NHQ86851.1 hypothetical protein [Iodobacter violacea]
MLNTTNQNFLFPVNYAYFRDRGSINDFSVHLQNQLFEIKNDLLYSLITYGDLLPKDDKFLPGFTKSKGVSTALLSFFVGRALDIYRLPFLPDRLLTTGMYFGEKSNTLKKILSSLDRNTVDEITKETLKIYEHTQKCLAKANLKEVILTRRVYDCDNTRRDTQESNYATLISRMKLAAEFYNETTIKFEMDTLNSFGDDGGYSNYPVTLEFQLPAEDIFYCANFIKNRKNRKNSETYSHSHAIEPGEWVVINKAIDGIVELPINQVHVNNKDFFDVLSKKKNWIDSHREQYSPIVLRNLTHLRNDYKYYGYGFEPKLFNRLIGAASGLVRGAIQGYKSGR